MLGQRLKALVDEFAKSLAGTKASFEASSETASDASPGTASENRTPSPAASSAVSPAASPVVSPLVALTADITQRIGASERPAPTAVPRVARTPSPASPAKPPHAPTSIPGASAAPSKRVVSPAAPTPVVTTPTVIATDDAFEDLDVLEYFRETWSKLSTDGNLRQSLAQVPENAGPLNSSHLVHRALSLMHDVSPDYLRHFLRHADALSWLEDMETTGVFGNKSAARVAASAKPSRAKAR